MHGKRYGPKTDGDRRKIWAKNALMIQQHNIRAFLGQETYHLKETRFMDYVLNIKLN